MNSDYQNDLRNIYMYVHRKEASTHQQKISVSRENAQIQLFCFFYCTCAFS